MKRSFILVTILILIIYLFNGCSKEIQKQRVIFFGESEKWIVIGTEDNKFRFNYKGNTDDLAKNNQEKKISFAYGTLQETTIITESLKSKAFYEVEYDDNFIKDIEVNSESAFNNNKFINVQISYGESTDHIDLGAYFSYEDN